MKKTGLLAFYFLCYIVTLAAEPDMIVLQSGESIQVFNLDITSGNRIYYTLGENADSPVEKVEKQEMLIIKKADGSTLLPSRTQDITLKEGDISNINLSQINPNAHEPITVKAIDESFIETGKIKKNWTGTNLFITAHGGYGNILNFRLLSEEDKTVALTKPGKKLKYNYEDVLIPEYIETNNGVYTVTEIDSDCFHYNGKIKNIIFPETLKVIRPSAFVQLWNLKNIVLPESIEEVEYAAFYICGTDCKTFDCIYIPKTIKGIGENAFLWVGPNTSYRKFYQGRLSSIPDWITTGNCTNYGIDEEAVEDYERKNGMRK